MKIYIPKVGDILELKKDWTFSLWSERRNVGLAEVLGFLSDANEPDHWQNLWKIHEKIEAQLRKDNTWGPDLEHEIHYLRYDTFNAGKVIFPTGTKLKVDRVYVRKGKSAEYNSLSFYIIYHKDKKLIKKRFWAELDDVNTMEIV